MFGLSDDQLTYLRTTVVTPIEKLGGRVWVFGSRARGDHQQHSDVDLLIEGDKRQLQPLIGEIRELLEDSRFPFVVDLALAEDLAASYTDSVFRDQQRFAAMATVAY